jgi:hypothetical protein
MKNSINKLKRENFRFLPFFLERFLKENEFNLNIKYIYMNLHEDAVRKRLLEETNNLGGIYLIFNNITGDYYIGSASTGKFFARFSNHLVYFIGSKVLKHAVRKYGLSNFGYLILELFPDKVNKENNKKLIDLEDFYIKSLLPNYNILTEAGSNFGYKHTELNRINIKTNFKLKRLEFSKQIFESKCVNDSKISILKNPIILYNLDYTVFGEYINIEEASKSINCESKTLIRALKSKKKILKRRFIIKNKNR